MSKKTLTKPSKASSRKAEPMRLAPRRRTRMIALEPRMLFDGALGLDLSAQATAVALGDASVKADVTVTPATPEAPKESSTNTAAASAQPASATPAEKDAAQKPGTEVMEVPSTATTHEILFIDGTLSKDTIEQIRASARADVETIVLDPSRDGVQQISEVLAAHDHIDAVHIVSHGGPGEIKLGTAILNLDTLQLRSAEVKGWGTHLNQGADLLLYGCDVAAGEMGAAYVQQLAEITGADVAGSTDITGSAAYGGDWTLETATGTIQTGLFGSEKFLADGQIELANTAPVLDATKSPALNSVLEDAAVPSGAVGTLVSSLVDLAAPA